MKRALVLTLAIVLGLSIATFAVGDMSGKWDTTFKITAFAPVTLTFTSALTVTYDIGGWKFTSYTLVDDTGWKDQTFSASGSLGAYTFGSTIDFNPLATGPTNYFQKWTVAGGVSIGGLTFDATFTLYPKNVSFVFGFSGATSLVTVDVDITFGTPGDLVCDLDFQSVKIVVGFPFCCAEVTSTLYFTCEGFQYVEFCVKKITIEKLPWMTLDACVKFEQQTKTMTITPQIDFGVVGCDFDLYLRINPAGPLVGPPFPDPPVIFDSIKLDGIKITCKVGDIDFTGLSYWGLASKKPKELGTYWEMYKIATSEDACCGGAFKFDVAVFFSATHASLFDVAEFQANISLAIATQFTFKMGLKYVVTPAVLKELTFGFLVTW
jgi:hypothetical protein